MDVNSVVNIASQLHGSGAVAVEMGIRSVEKSNDLVEQQGEAMINLIEASSVVDASKGKIDAYA